MTGAYTSCKFWKYENYSIKMVSWFVSIVFMIMSAMDSKFKLFYALKIYSMKILL